MCKQKSRVKLFCVVMVSMLLSAMFTGFTLSNAYAAEQPELLLNPGFETVNGNSASNWFPSTGSANWGTEVNGTTISVSNTEYHSGSKSIKIDTTSSTANPWVNQTLRNVIPDAEYTVSAWLKSSSMAGNGAAFKYEFYSDDTVLTNDTLINGYTSEYFKLTNEAWNEAVTKVVIPQNCKAVKIYLRLYGAGTVYYDDASFKKVYIENQTNTLLNSGFEAVTGNVPDGWEVFGDTWEGSGPVSLSTTGAHSGTNCVKISTTSSSQNPWIRQAFTNVTPGVTYVLSGWLKSSSMSGNGAAFKYEFYSENEFNNDTYINGYASSYFKTGYTDGAWHYVEETFTIPQGVKAIRLYFRLYGAGTIYWDDLSFGLPAQQPEQPRFFLSTDNIFYYSDWPTGTVHAKMNTLFPIVDGSKIDFKIKDGSTVIAQQLDMPAVADTTYTFDTSVLATLKKEYTVEVTYKDSAGKPIQTPPQTTTIYRYDRPASLRSDGTYMVDGKPFFPVIGYHVKIDQLPLCSAVGVNVVQSPDTSNTDTLKTYLDTAAANNIKVLVRLYNGMKPAGNAVNVANTKNWVTLFKDHPAVYGWMIMDEPYLRTVKGVHEDLVNSYKIIRDIDPVHPTYMVENFKYYYEDTGKCTDILSIDPYPLPGSTVAKISEFAGLANAAVNYKKPVYNLLQAFTFTGYPYLPTIDEIRNMAYRAVWEGCKGIGYYSFTDPGWDLTKSDRWSGLIEFNQKELGYLGGYTTGTLISFNESNTGNACWKTWTTGTSVYAVVMNSTASEQTVEIPLVNKENTVSYIGYTGELVAGGPEKSIDSLSGTLSLTLTGNQVAVYKLSPYKLLVQAYVDILKNAKIDSADETWITNINELIDKANGQLVQLNKEKPDMAPVMNIVRGIKSDINDLKVWVDNSNFSPLVKDVMLAHLDQALQPQLTLYESIHTLIKNK